MTATVRFDVPLPLDTAAEECAAGIAIDSCRGAQLMRSRVTGHDFHDRRLWRIIEAAASCPHLFTCAEASEQRLDRIQTATGETWGRLRQLSEQPRRCLTDERGHYSRRVIAAANARRRLAEIEAELEQIGSAA